MIIRGNPLIIAGGGGSKGLDVVTYPSIPAAVTANRFACITEIAPAVITADTVEPTDGAVGDIWIEMGSEEDLVALGSDTNKVVVRPRRVRQFSGVYWNPIDAYLGVSGEWVKVSSRVTEMGVRHTIAGTSPLLERLGASVGLSAEAGIGTVAQVSDFDAMPIYREIRRCNLNADGTVAAWEGETGFSLTKADVMVFIPKFWYNRKHDGTNDVRWAADGPAEGYEVHPAFVRGANLPDRDGFFISAFEASAGYVSVSGKEPLTNITRDAARTGARAKGTGWSQPGIAHMMAINHLLRIEYASNNGQEAIAPGISNSSKQNTGTTNSMAGHTGRPAGTADAVGMKWRGIENLWGNVWTWVDGLNMNGVAYYYCLDPNYWADDTTNYYTAAGFSAPSGASGSYVKTMGYNAACPWFVMPNGVGGSETTFYCDGLWTSTGWRVAFFGGSYGLGALCGPAAWSLYYTSSTAYSNVGCRLLYQDP